MYIQQMIRGMLASLLLITSLCTAVLLHILEGEVAVNILDCKPPAILLYSLSYVLFCSAVVYFFLICIPLVRTLLRNLCNLHTLPPLFLTAVSVYQLIETLKLDCGESNDYVQVTSFASSGISCVLFLLEALTLKESRPPRRYETVEEA